MADREYSIKAVIGAVDRATAPVRAIARRISTAMRGAVKVIGAAAKGVAVIGAAAAAAAYGVYRFVSSYAKQADELSKFSRQVAVNIIDLQELRFAAERTGVGAENLTKGIEKFTKNLGEAKAGTGTLITFLNRGPKAFQKQLMGAKSNTEALNLMINALASIRDPSTRAALANAAFGRSGLKMVRIVDEGVDGLAKLRTEARKYGLVSATAGRASEAFVDAQTNLSAALAGLKNTIGEKLLPLIQPMIERTKEWILANRELIATKVEAAISTVIGAMKSLYEWWGKNQTAVVRFGKDAMRVLGTVGKMVAFIIRGLALISSNPISQAKEEAGVKKSRRAKTERWYEDFLGRGGKLIPPEIWKQRQESKLDLLQLPSKPGTPEDRALAAKSRNQPEESWGAMMRRLDVGGKLEIEIKSDAPVKVRKLKSNNKAMEITTKLGSAALAGT